MPSRDEGGNTFATRLMLGGVSPDLRMVLMGHTRSRSIQWGYIHTDLVTKRWAIGQLEAWKKKQEKTIGNNKARWKRGLSFYCIGNPPPIKQILSAQQRYQLSSANSLFPFSNPCLSK
jgi:hypothetical protein